MQRPPRRALAAAVVLTALTGGGLVSTSSPAAAYVCGPVQVTRTTAQGIQDPTLSDDGGTVAFVSDNDHDPSVGNADGNYELFRYRPGEGFTQLTDTTSGTASEVSVDADGDRLAFVSSQDLVPPGNISGSEELFLFDDDLGTFTQATDSDGSSASLPRINDAGTKVVFTSTEDLVPSTGNVDGNSELFLYAVGGAIDQVTDTVGYNVNEPSIGSDLVAFWSSLDLDPGVGNADASAEIFTYDSTGSAITQITDDPSDGSFTPVVSGDDSTVAFPSIADLDPAVGNDDGNGDLFTFDVGTATIDQRTDTLGNGSGTMTVDGDGDRLAFVSGNDLDPNRDNSDGSQEVFVVDTDDGEIDQVTDLPSGNADYPVIDAAGTRIAMSTTGNLTGDNPDGSFELAVADCGANGPTFDDVAPTANYAEQIEWMAAADVASGFPDGGFHPQEFVKRQQMANFLYNLAGRPPFVPPVNSARTFSDYPASSTYYLQVEWMAAEAIVPGFPDGGFHPQEFVKRQQMANFLYNLAGQPAFTPPDDSARTFSDYPASSTYYLQVEWMAAEAVASGFPDGTFHPQDFVKRQQMANFLHNLVNGPGVDLG